MTQMRLRQSRASRRTARRPVTARNGAIFITALGIIVILTSLALVFAQHMRVESLASANRLSYSQASAIEIGAEQWVQAQVDSYVPNALEITQTPAEAIQIGDGYFWILHPNPTSDQNYSTGITDEAGKLNINTPTRTDTQLEALPGMTSSMADSILAWTGNAGGADGATNDYYESLAEPYDSKNGAFESVEELLLVKDITRDVLYGQDLNHDGVVTDAERAIAAAAPTVASSDSLLGGSSGGAASGLSSLFNNTSRGFFNDVTIYSFEPSKGRVNINTSSSAGTLGTLLKNAVPGNASSILSKWQARFPRGRNTSNMSMLDFFKLTGMQLSDFGKIADKLSVAPAPSGKLIGQVNVNTAPKEVFMALGVQDSDADSLVSAQQANANSGTTSIAWAFSNNLPASTIVPITPFLTGSSYQYSADIVAVAKDGRAFKRVRIVVDGSTTPSTIVYRKDLTSLGWPLPDSIHQAMRSGQAPPTGIMVSSLGNALGGSTFGQKSN